MGQPLAGPVLPTGAWLKAEGPRLGSRVSQEPAEAQESRGGGGRWGGSVEGMRWWGGGGGLLPGLGMNLASAGAA